MKIPERILWASKLVDMKNSYQVLEIGCGTGLLAHEISKRLTKGKLTCVDQSTAMIANANKKNLLAVENGLIEFVTDEFIKHDFERQRFDRIFAFNVNIFLKNPEATYIKIKKLLKPKGQLYIFHQAPYQITIAATKPYEQALSQNSFRVVHKELKRLEPTSAFCIIAETAS